MSDTPHKPPWLNMASMYAGAYLVVRAVEDFEAGAAEVHEANGSPDDMESYMRGLRVTKEDARKELDSIAKQVPAAMLKRANAAMEELIKCRKKGGRCLVR